MQLAEGSRQKRARSKARVEDRKISKFEIANSNWHHPVFGLPSPVNW
jgi:hypothetical protein